MIKKIIISLIGNCILGCGLAFGAQARLGMDPCVSFSQSVSNISGYQLGTIITIVNIILIIIVLILKPKNIGLTTLCVVFLNGYFTDFFANIISLSSSLTINIIYCLICNLLVAIGCNIMIDANIGMGIYDAFVFSIADKTNKEYVYVRYIIDAIFLLGTYLLHGYIGIGTLIAYILTGNLIKYTKPYIDKIMSLLFI